MNQVTTDPETSKENARRTFREKFGKIDVNSMVDEDQYMFQYTKELGESQYGPNDVLRSKNLSMEKHIADPDSKLPTQQKKSYQGLYNQIFTTQTDPNQVNSNVASNNQEQQFMST